MALTVAITRRNVMGHQNIISGTIAFDSSYATGGESFAPADLGLRVIDLMLFQQNTIGLTFSYDYTNSKVQAYAQGHALGTAAGGTPDDFTITAGPGVGASEVAIYATGSTTHVTGPLKEVPNTNDLSTVTGVRFVAIGV